MIVKLLLLTMLALPLAGGPSTGNRNPNPLPLSDIILSAADVGGNPTVATDKPLTPMMLESRRGALAQVRRDNTVGGYWRVFRRGSLHVGLRLIEFTNNQWATDTQVKSDGTLKNQLPPGARSARQTGADGEEIVVLDGVRGRVRASVLLWSEAGRPASTDLELGIRLLTVQTQRLPETSDLAPIAAERSGRAFGFRLGAILAALIVLTSAFGSAISALRDRGSREWLRRGQGSSLDPSRAIDITEPVRRASRAARLGAAAKVVGLAVVTGGLVAAPGVPIWVAFGIVLAILLVASCVGVMRRVNGPHDLTRLPMIGRVVAGVGSGLSAATLVASLALLTAACAGYLFAPGSVRALFITVPMALCGISITASARKPARLARRLLQPMTRTAIEADPRRHVMLLRSFQDDALEVRALSEAGTSPMDGIATEAYSRFEEIVAWQLWKVGPVVAIGQPGTVLQPLGAARSYYSDDTWQSAVTRQGYESAMVAVVVGRSPGLQWEIANLRGSALLAKCVFVLPPVEVDELVGRLVVLAASLGVAPEAFEFDADRLPVAFYFTKEGEPRTIVVQGRSARAYLVALQHATAVIAAQREARLAGPADVWRAPPEDVSGLLETFDPDKVVRPRKSFVSALADGALVFVR